MRLGLRPSQVHQWNLHQKTSESYSNTLSHCATLPKEFMHFLLLQYFLESCNLQFYDVNTGGVKVLCFIILLLKLMRKIPKHHFSVRNPLKFNCGRSWYYRGEGLA